MVIHFDKADTMFPKSLELEFVFLLVWFLGIYLLTVSIQSMTNFIFIEISNNLLQKRRDNFPITINSAKRDRYFQVSPQFKRLNCE